MLNYLWLGMLLVGVVVAGITGRVQASVDAVVKGAETAVTLAIGLVGLLSLWLGVMRLAEKSGLVTLLARALRPIMRRLFPDVPSEHPAVGSMTLNIAANMLGLTNAATPFGLRAMRDLEALNPRPGVATNAMCTFLAINTGSVQLVPASAIALLAAAGSINPTTIVGSTLVATTCSSLAGLVAVKTLEKLRPFRLPPAEPLAAAASPTDREGEASALAQPADGPLPWWARLILMSFIAGFVCLVLSIAFPSWFGRTLDAAALARSVGVRILDAISVTAIPFLLGFFPLYAALRRIPVYEEFVEGAREGFQVAVRIIPYLVAMLIAIGFFRGSGAMEFLTELLRPPLLAVGFPPELVPLSLIRPLSGSASLATVSELAKTFGGDSLIARTAGTIFGSTETTFYVIAVYFGSVNVRRTRHAVWAGLIADLAGVVAAVFVCRWMFS